MLFKADVIIVGAGHAGCEAACAAARLGAEVCLVTMDMNKIAQMSCNPAVGGIAKGQIVREIDALGGQMGLVTDQTAIQFRMLNRGKGPAMWSPRAQADRQKFISKWRETLDGFANLHIWQDQAAELIVENGRAVGVTTVWGHEIRGGAVVITAGTFLNGLLHVGPKMIEGGRCAEPAAKFLTKSITRHGIRSARMKTGTPVRIDRKSVDFSQMERQDGDETASFFSFMGEKRSLPQLPCWTCWTNAEAHRILREALPYSPLYNGQIQSTGPRYCPSIETKLHTFPDKDRHPLFLEPEGTNTDEMYLNGFSSSMPCDVQIEALRQIPAFRNVRIYRPGYAIEYDYFDPTQLKPSLESKLVGALFMAGQVNGTTGYEEAAGQGMMAGVNAARLCAGQEAVTLRRDEAYIGVLIDDLTTKGVDEPYRMFTSRAEYRILLRQDNADARLTEKGHSIGLATEERFCRYKNKAAAVEKLISFCEKLPMKAAEINPVLGEIGTTPLTMGTHLAELLTRPQVRFCNIAPAIPQLQQLIDGLGEQKDEIIEEAEIAIKYRGYIDREKQAAEKMQRLENIRIKGKFDYSRLKEISTEGRQKLQRIDPETLAQASRIPGVSPSDINVLLVLLHR